MGIEQKRVILLVEDNQMDIDLTLDAFRAGGTHTSVQVVTTGEAAMDYLRGSGPYADRNCYPFPDVILLDLKLPGISGHDVLEWTKSEPDLRRIPVIILTSSADLSDREKGYDLGANSYLVKPIEFKNFLHVVQTFQEYWLGTNLGPPQTRLRS